MNLNFLNQVVYTGSLYFGSSAIASNVMFDTNANWLSIHTVQCKTCILPRYDPTLSNTATIPLDQNNNTIKTSVNVSKFIINRHSSYQKSFQEFMFQTIFALMLLRLCV